MAIPEQPFGFVAGRWVLSLADTPMDSDRAPDYKPLYPGSVVFNNKLSHRVVGDGAGGTIGIVKTRYEAKLNEDGRLIDAEEHEFVALPVGVYSVTFSFGQYSWPNFDIEVKAEHTIDSPLWLPSKSPIPAGPGVVHVVSEEARLAAEAAAASAWEAVDTPGRQGIQGIQGPPGDLDTEHLAGAPRLTNPLHDIAWGTSGATIHSQTARTVTFTPTTDRGYINGPAMSAPGVHYFTAEVKTTSDQIFIGALNPDPVYHSGSGEWERLTGRITLRNSTPLFTVRNNYSSDRGQVEVRDPVLINLTEVFGDGREPSKEYMDELMAKHGNYIGAVEPFVFGDAAQTQTVAGPGMTLRHDNSVGTRVFLDHPGGTTLLYGDTGWRLIPVTSTQIPALNHMLIRRTTHHLHAVIYANMVFTPGSWETIATLPPGFLTATNTWPTRRRVPFANMNAYDPHTIRPPSTVIVFQDEIRLRMEGQMRLHATLTTYAESAWPTTLPGEPA